MELNGYVFDSDNLDPLVFRVEPEGYTWVKGKGTVQIPAGSPEAIVLARGVTSLPDGRTFLLPPGTREPAPSQLSTLGPNQKIGVCGNQLTLAALTQTADGITLQFRLTKPPAAGRVNLALLDAQGRRYKPTKPELTWGTVTRDSGIQFPITTAPTHLEFEGLLIMFPEILK